ncbi:MAG: Smr/MutS family protein [Rikenellaceae bacterium]
MIYPNDFELRLSFDRIRNMVRQKCVTQLAKDMLDAVTFSSTYDYVNSMLSETSEMKTILMMESDFPTSGYVDITYFLRKIKVEGVYLDTTELQQLVRGLQIAEELLRFFASKEAHVYPFLNKKTEGVTVVGDVISKIDTIVDRHAKIKDSASPELLRIRQELRSKEQQVSRRLQSILRSAQSSGIVEEDAQITIRDGRAVVPVSASNKRKINGFVHDESATGKTVYIEPIEIVELNNEIKELEYAERREIKKILVDFSNYIRPYVGELILSGEFVSTIDFIKSKAQVAIDMTAEKPILTNGAYIELIGARHPLLERTLKQDNKPIVPLTLTLNREKHILVISGPNAGGKSVCLKTVGLLQYMLQCGFLVPVSPNSNLGIFKNIFIDIGDQQSIDNDLSTYSSHLANMKTILRSADNKSLVLIDEFGTGTEPTMGGAIAETILERIESKGVFGVITTHYSNIKYYASNAKGVINGAMSFDVQNIKPLFGLEIGKPGSSFAFEIARKTGLPEEVVKSAQEKIGSSQINIEKQLREIARDKKYWENKRDRIRIAEKRTDELAEKYEKELSVMREERNRIVSEAKEEAKRIVSEANRVIENTVRQIKEAQAEKERTRVIRRELEDFKDELYSQEQVENDLKIERKIEQLRRKEEKRAERKKNRTGNPQAETPAPQKPKKLIPETGDKVRIKGQNVIGEVLKIESKRALIAFGHISTQVDIKKLEIVSNAEFKRQNKQSDIPMGQFLTKENVNSNNYNTLEKRNNFTGQIDVRGQRVEEAIRKAEEFVDEATMLGISEIKILHGKGTGALKEEIRRYLKLNPYVVSAKDEHVEFGGAGITVIKLSV